MKEVQNQAAWNADPKQSRKSSRVGEIGSHIENMVDYAGGTKGLQWSSQVAADHDKALRAKVFGGKGVL